MHWGDFYTSKLVENVKQLFFIPGFVFENDDFENQSIRCASKNTEINLRGEGNRNYRTSFFYLREDWF